jgi:hypothetical protein
MLWHTVFGVEADVEASILLQAALLAGVAGWLLSWLRVPPPVPADARR